MFSNYPVGILLSVESSLDRREFRRAVSFGDMNDQQGTIRLESIIYIFSVARTNTDVMLHWNGTSPLTFNRGIKMANFELEKFEHLNSCPRTNIHHIDTGESLDCG